MNAHATLLAFVLIAQSAGAADRFVHPTAGYSVSVPAGWSFEGHDINSDRASFRSALAIVAVTSNETCWLTDLSEAELKEAEVTLFGLGNRLRADTFQVNHRPAQLVVYDGEPTGSDRLPIRGCVALADIWILFEGSISRIDAEEDVQRLMQGTVEAPRRE